VQEILEIIKIYPLKKGKEMEKGKLVERRYNTY